MWDGAERHQVARLGVPMVIRVAVWVTVVLIVFIVLMAGFARMAPIGSDLQQFGQGFFDFLDRITPGT
jgi:hypothetical protein